MGGGILLFIYAWSIVAVWYSFVRPCSSFGDALVKSARAIMRTLKKGYVFFAAPDQPATDTTVMHQQAMALAERAGIYEHIQVRQDVNNLGARIWVRGELLQRYRELSVEELEPLIERHVQVAYERYFGVGEIPVWLDNVTQDGYRMILPMTMEQQNRIQKANENKMNKRNQPLSPYNMEEMDGDDENRL